MVRHGAQAVLFAGLAASQAVYAYDFAPAPPGFVTGAADTFQFYVADQVTYDDNLFRVPPGTAGVPGAVYPNSSQSDAVNVTTLGGEGTWDIGKQQVDVDLRADENRFKRNDDLDYVSANAVGTWNWRVGEQFSGQVQTFYDRTLASFSETRFSGKDIIHSLEELGYGRYQIGPHWALYGQVRGSYLDHSAVSQQYDDFHNKAGFVGAEYAFNTNDTIAFEYSYLHVTFAEGPPPIIADNYDEDVEKVVFKYSLSDKTSVNGYAGFLRRTYPSFTDLDPYQGGIGRVYFNWATTDKTTIQLGAYRELHAYVDAESNYFVAKGVILSPVWTATEKLTVTLLGNYEKDNYIGNSNAVVSTGPADPVVVVEPTEVVVATGAREDKINSEQLNIQYVPRPQWIVNAFFRHSKRQSNQYLFSFDDNLVNASVTYRFW